MSQQVVSVVGAQSFTLPGLGKVSEIKVLKRKKKFQQKKIAKNVDSGKKREKEDTRDGKPICCCCCCCLFLPNRLIKNVVK